MVRFDDFTKNRSGPAGFGGYCKECKTALQADIREAIRESALHEGDCDCSICAVRMTIDPESKSCTKCGATKARSDFWADPASIDELRNWCIECCADYQKQEGRWTYRKYQHTLDKGDFWTLYNAQEGKCATCDRPVPEPDICIDHDHRCCPGRSSCGGCIRALLCRKCNTALGMIDDDPNTALALAAYLMRFEIASQQTI